MTSSMLIYFDLETSGLSLTHPVIQLAAVATRDGKELSSFECKLAFDEKEADPKALELNHYDPAVWAKEAKSASEAIRSFDTWAAPYRSVKRTSQRTGNDYYLGQLAGYNALTFDLPRLRALYGTDFFPFSYQVRDILQRVFFYFDEHPLVTPPVDFKLSTVASFFGFTVDGAHDALTDVHLTHLVHRRLIA